MVGSAGRLGVKAALGADFTEKVAGLERTRRPISPKPAAIAFTAYSLVRYLEYRVKLQHIKLSPEEIRKNLIGVQASILYDKSKKIRYGLPSRMSKHARKIYDILEVTRRCTPYIIEKM